MNHPEPRPTPPPDVAPPVGLEGAGTPHDETSPANGAAPIIAAERLFAGRNEVLIELDGQVYRLRRTRSGKLILNK